MSTLAVAQPTLEGLGPGATLEGRGPHPAVEGVGPRPTLGDLVDGAWARLSTHQAVECPVCHGEMEPEYGARALPVGGRCRECGTVLR